MHYSIYLQKIVTLLLLSLLAVNLPAQQLTVSYETDDLGNDQHLVRVYLQSTGSEQLKLGAINLSVAYDGECLTSIGQETIFDEDWTTHLVDNQQYTDMALFYESALLDTRLQYGNADPGLPMTASIMVPSATEAPLQVMELTFEGACSETIYLEHVSENPLNQYADDLFRSIDYEIIHPPQHATTSVEEDFTSSLEVVAFPNPTEGPVTVTFKGEIPQGKYQFLLIDSQGRTLRKTKRTLSRAFDLTLAAYTEGVYYLEVRSIADDKHFRTITLIRK